MQLPATFGKYELLERLATGGMAEVYLARSFGVAGFEKRLVIKRIRPELASDPHHISMFINEAKIGVHLNHENVVQVYDLGRVGRDWYIAMEHLHGRDLNKVVKALRAQERKLPQRVAVHIVAEVCRGLAYAHGLTDNEGRLAGLVHRDVSPHNVLITYGGAVKLVDFGIARLMGGTTASPTKVSTDDNSTVKRRPGGGKYAYMSPEQALGKTVDHRTDVFSTGIVLWELLVGHRLYQHEDPVEKLRLVREAIVPSPADECIEIDSQLQAILDRALTADRNVRYPTAALLEEDLRAWLYDQGLTDGRGAVIEQMQQAFPSVDSNFIADLNLERMAADVQRLGHRDSATCTPAQTPSEIPAPVRMQSNEGERKRVVAMIIDVDGMTELSMRLEPDALFKRHFQLLRWLKGVVQHYDGIVQRAVDDQILLLFGVPRTRLDDFARALECALELQRTVDTLNSHGLSVSLAIGIHSGDVTVRTTTKTVKYVARGDTTRLARRLSNMADHAQTVVSERVLDASQSLFRFRRGPDIINRGGRPPTGSFLLEGRQRGLRVAGKGPWLRRGGELDQIRTALVELASGNGSVLTLIGDQGSGKSRLASELTSLATRRAIPVYTGRCLPYGEHGPLAPFREIVLDVLGLEPEVPKNQIKDELDRLAQLGLGARNLLAISTLMGLGPARGLDDEDRWRALGQLFEGLARDGAAMIVLENVHHLAEPECAHLAELATRLRAHQVLLIFTHTNRPTGQLANLGEEVVLGPFDRQGVQRLLRHLLEAKDVANDVIDLACRSCEGNPLYVEEVAKYLVQEGMVTVADGIASFTSAPTRPTLPDSIAGLIAARIDALEAASKGALQLAATIGVTFNLPLLGQAMGIEDPTPLVTDLSSHGLIRRIDADQ
ncbi:MAG: serine/threonine protein kinase, partial [Kiritimatiellia bacterium]